MRPLFVILGTLIFCSFSALGQSDSWLDQAKRALGFGETAHKHLREGDRSYIGNDFQLAEEEYRKAIEKKERPEATYNLGNTIYEQERFEEAIKHYSQVAEEANDGMAKSFAYHNLGNSYFQQQDYEKSIEAYKNSLRLNPSDKQTKYNLTMAQRLLQQQQQQQQNQQENKDGKENEQKQEENQEQQQQEQQEQQKEQQKNENDQQSVDNDKQQQDLKEQDLNREEAKQLLQIMEEEERKVQKKLRKAQTTPSKSNKDW